MAIRRKEVVTKIQKRQMEVTIKKTLDNTISKQGPGLSKYKYKIKDHDITDYTWQVSTLAFLLNS